MEVIKPPHPAPPSARPGVMRGGYQVRPSWNRNPAEILNFYLENRYVAIFSFVIIKRLLILQLVILSLVAVNFKAVRKVV